MVTFGFHGKGGSRLEHHSSIVCLVLKRQRPSPPTFPRWDSPACYPPTSGAACQRAQPEPQVPSSLPGVSLQLERSQSPQKALVPGWGPSAAAWHVWPLSREGGRAQTPILAAQRSQTPRSVGSVSCCSRRCQGHWGLIKRGQGRWVLEGPFLKCWLQDDLSRGAHRSWELPKGNVL